jgi:hypothetical protein
MAAVDDAVIVTRLTNGRRELVRFAPTVAGSIAGTAFDDTDGDGVRDAGEPPVARRVIWLDLNGNGLRDADEGFQRTDNSGGYRFAGLAAGTYHVRQELPPGIVTTTPPADLTLAAGQALTGVDLGAHAPDTSPPMLFRTDVNMNPAGTQVRVDFRFDEDLVGIDAGDLTLVRLDTGGGGGDVTIPLDASQVAWSSDWRRVRVTLDPAGMSSGIYRLTLAAAAQVDAYGNHALDDATVQFLLVAPGATFQLGQTTAVQDVALAPGGAVDVGEHALVVDYAAGGPSAYGEIAALLTSGRHGGDWSGSGIVSSSAAGNLTTLGVAEASQVLTITGTQTAVFAGQPVDSSAVLVKFTYAGDANLDGKINVDDYGRIDLNAGHDTGGWFNGDFNFDGKINVDDYGIIDFNVGIQGPPLAGVANRAVSAASAANAGAVSIVPRALAPLQIKRREWSDLL